MGYSRLAPSFFSALCMEIFFPHTIPLEFYKRSFKGFKITLWNVLQIDSFIKCQRGLYFWNPIIWMLQFLPTFFLNFWDDIFSPVELKGLHHSWVSWHQDVFRQRFALIPLFLNYRCLPYLEQVWDFIFTSALVSESPWLGRWGYRLPIHTNHHPCPSALPRAPHVLPDDIAVFKYTSSFSD